MAQWFFCSRLWCPIEDDDGYKMIKASEIIVGEEAK